MGTEERWFPQALEEWCDDYCYGGYNYGQWATLEAHPDFDPCVTDPYMCHG